MNLNDYPCEKCKETSGYTQTENGGMKRCDCAYVTKLVDHIKHKNDYYPQRISTEHATICAEMMATIPFFPGESGARIAIADEIASMAHDNSQAVWIARRMIRLYSRWPGLAEMRLVFWQSHKTLDGIEPNVQFSEHYPRRIPQENAEIFSRCAGLLQGLRKSKRPSQN